MYFYKIKVFATQNTSIMNIFNNKKELSMKRHGATLNTILTEKSQSERLHAV